MTFAKTTLAKMWCFRAFAPCAGRIFLAMACLVFIACNGGTGNTSPVAPSIATQPQNASVVMGQTATFSVVAIGTQPLSYQWQKNGANISGATSASYTTPAAVAGDNGATFRVIVSNGTQPNATSNSATLTIGTSVP